MLLRLPLSLELSAQHRQLLAQSKLPLHLAQCDALGSRHELLKTAARFERTEHTEQSQP